MTGSPSCAESLAPQTLQSLLALLSRAVAQEGLLILATGGGAEVDDNAASSDSCSPEISFPGDFLPRAPYPYQSFDCRGRRLSAL